MPNKFQSLLQSLQAASEQINQQSDALLNAIKGVEAAIARLNIGLYAWITLSKGVDEESGSTHEIQLGYSKSTDSKRWGLQLCYERDGDITNCIKLIDAPRDEKVAAVAKLEELLVALTKEAKRKAAEISAATATADQFIKQLSPQKEGEAPDEDDEHNELPF